jgi:uncharacterized protein
MSYIITQSKKIFDFHDPVQRTYDIEDIAHSLSNICRYNGHTPSFYSVAQHSVLVANRLPRELQMAGLLHDASEAYLGDVTTPLKKKLKDYKYYEDAFMYEISTVYGFDYPFHKEIKNVDQRMLITEAVQFYGQELVEDWESYIEPFNLIIDPLPPSEARDLFLFFYNHIKPTHEKNK